MFNQIITQTPLTDDIANGFFRDKVCADSHMMLRNQKDVSLLATSIVLFYPRLKDGEQLRVSSLNYQGCRISVGDIRTWYQDDRMYTDNIYIFRVIVIDREKISQIEENYVTINRDYCDEKKWQEIEKIKLFFEPNFPVRVYTDPEERISYMFVELPRSTDALIKCYHTIQSALLTANPWFYDSEKDKDSVTDLELNMLQSFFNGNVDTYLQCLQDFADKLNFREEAILKQLADFEHQLDEQRAADISYKISSTTADIERKMDELSILVRRKKDYQLREQALKIGIAQKEGQFVLRDYFAAHNDITYLGKMDTSIDFRIDRVLTEWQTDAVHNAIHNRRSVIFDEVPSSNTSLYDGEDFADVVERFLVKIFETREVKIHMASVYQLTADAKLYPKAGVSDIIPTNLMPNPHHGGYSCLGGYEGDIINALENEDFAFALEIAAVASGNINLEDSTVMHDWSKLMFQKGYDKRTCFEIPDGSRVTLKEAIQWMLDQEKEQKGE